ncbi:response regulator [Rhizobium sp. ARZ01]|nr:response regulator [Rhizobium sp. ARZ01]MBD9375586.1 response regulator [Rhizobium sp. ARZ01]
MELEDLLIGMEHEVVASVAWLDKALQLAAHADIDFAILDINLGGTKSFPVATILRRRNIPFLFASGYGSPGLSEEFSNELTLQKPYCSQDLKRAIVQACTRLI